jgi:hypothetical protein
MAIDDLKESLGINDDDFEGMKNGVAALDKSTSKFRKGAKGAKSIVKAAKGNIFEFPVFVSSSVPLDYATATTSLLEQVYASFLQMAISANPVITAKSAANGSQFAHLKSDTNKYLECVDTTYQADACHNRIDLGYTMNGDGKFIEFSLINIDDGEARIINEQCDYQPLSEFDHFFQEAKGSNPKDYPEAMKELAKERRRSEALAGKAAEATKLRYANSALEKDSAANAKKLEDLEKKYDALEKKYEKATDDAAEAKEQRAKDQAEREAASHKKEMEKVQLEIDKLKKDSGNYDLEKKLSQGVDINKGRISAPQFMDETKIQKLNTMKPLMMTVDLNVEGKDGRIVQGVEYIVGVKAYNRLVDSATLPEVVEYPLKEMNKITRKAKWRAGELKFFKDILFKIPQKKQTAIDSRDPKRKWYRRLYELAHIKGDAPANSLASGNGIIGTFYKGKTTHGVIPNATLVISKSDVDTIKRETKIDMLKGSTAAQFCNELFLMGMVVIDYDAESICTLFPDIHNNYEVHSLAAVNKQISILDTSGAKTREAFKMLG